MKSTKKFGSILTHWIELWRYNHERCTGRMGENENCISD